MARHHSGSAAMTSEERLKRVAAHVGLALPNAVPPPAEATTVNAAPSNCINN
jgi:hypothetical protein